MNLLLKVVDNIGRIKVKRKWREANFCNKCNHELNEDEIWLNDATCPYCGINHDYWVEHYPKIYYLLDINPGIKWWEFWKKPIYRRVYKDEPTEVLKDQMLNQLSREGL